MTILTVFFTCTINAFGHPPADMDAIYDANENSISVSLRHRTFDGNSHRISTYNINIDGKNLEFDKSNQEGNTPTVTLTLGDIQLSDDSKVIIKATCSLFGSLTTEFRFLDGNLIKTIEELT